MINLKNPKSALLLCLTLVITGCDLLKPETTEVVSYPEIDELFRQQMKIIGKQIEKEVRLDGKSEKKNFAIDTMVWKREFWFLKTINPNQPGYTGALREKTDGKKKQLSLKEGEKGFLKSFVHELTGENRVTVRAIIHEDKDVFVHHRDIELTFENGLISSYFVDGYQKIMLKDTIHFRISGIIH